MGIHRISPPSARWAILLTVVLVILSGPVIARAAEPEPETRALWVVRGDLYSRGGVDYVLRFAETLGVNMLIVQVTSSGSTLIDSDLLPRAPQVTPGFDPLEYIIERAHSAGIEVHAWINALVQSGFSSLPEGDYIVNHYPEYITYDVHGRSLLEMVGLLRDRIPSDLPGLMLEPTLPAVRALVAAHAAEVASRYDVDGIHLDYIRYAGRNYGYNPETRADFKAIHGHDPLDFAPPSAVAFGNQHGQLVRAELERAWDEYRRDAVTQTVSDVYQAVTEVKPWVVVSAAVFANQPDAYQYRFQDWTAWLRSGLIDLAVPMAYGTNPSVVRHQIDVAVQAAKQGGRHVVAGLGSYNVKDDRDTMVRLLEEARLSGAQGFALFSYQSIIGHLQTFLLVRDLLGDSEVPSVPAMPWKPPRANRSGVD